jgi:hypothetical protein
MYLPESKQALSLAGMCSVINRYPRLPLASLGDPFATLSSC